MSIEVMKRIKSLLQDGDKIDSHTISAVVAECDAVILTQQPDNASCKSVQKRHQAQQPATGEPVAWMASYVDPIGNDHVYVTSHHDLAVENDMHGTPRPLYTHPAPSVPADVVRVPVQVLKDASEALGNFVSDHGWGDADMQAMDNLDAYIARHEANRAAMLAAK